MTKQEFDTKKQELKTLNMVLNLIFISLCGIIVVAVIWLIWGGGELAWKTLLTSLFLVIVDLGFYTITCYKYYKEDAEDELVDEMERPTEERPTQRNYERGFKWLNLD